MKNENVSLVLLHYPALSPEGEVIITSFTTMDLHDVARPVRAYELKCFYIVQPVEAQQEIIRRQIEYWSSEEGRRANPTRAEVVSLVRVRYNLEEVLEDFKGRETLLVGTTARSFKGQVSFKEMRKIIEGNREKEFLLIFGTGYGIPPDLLLSFDYVLEPILGAGDWNHLSVRNAVSIVLDRLFSRNSCFTT